MIQKYIIDKVDIPRLLNGEEIPLEQGNKARAFCVEIAGGMTNGEVVKAVFPSFTVEVNSDWVACWVNPHDTIGFDKDWWNAPYKGVSE